MRVSLYFSDYISQKTVMPASPLYLSYLIFNCAHESEFGLNVFAMLQPTLFVLATQAQIIDRYVIQLNFSFTF